MFIYLVILFTVLLLEKSSKLHCEDQNLLSNVLIIMTITIIIATSFLSACYVQVNFTCLKQVHLSCKHRHSCDPVGPHVLVLGLNFLYFVGLKKCLCVFILCPISLICNSELVMIEQKLHSFTYLVI